jgi:hypothetical protein
MIEKRVLTLFAAGHNDSFIVLADVFIDIEEGYDNTAGVSYNIIGVVQGNSRDFDKWFTWSDYTLDEILSQEKNGVALVGFLNREQAIKSIFF